jgi:hypothetical protein
MEAVVTLQRPTAPGTLLSDDVAPQNLALGSKMDAFQSSGGVYVFYTSQALACLLNLQGSSELVNTANNYCAC